MSDLFGPIPEFPVQRTLVLSRAEDELLVEGARRRGISTRQLVREALREYLTPEPEVTAQSAACHCWHEFDHLGHRERFCCLCATTEAME